MAEPSFPPLLNGHSLPADSNLIQKATKKLENGAIGAGDLIWSQSQDRLLFALVLEPEIIVQNCPQIMLAAMVAFGDAVGAICPPEVAISYQWPSSILMNGASIGKADLLHFNTALDQVPNYLLLTIDVDIRPQIINDNPGLDEYHTTMWDEGCGDITQIQLLESVARHLVNWIHNWSQEGFKPVHENWWGRVNKKKKLDPDLSLDDWQMLGLDENGNALITQDQHKQLLLTLDALEKLRGKQQ